MSARRHLHLLLVASLIVFLFALIPASAEETKLDISEINHFNTKSENAIITEINNLEGENINCNLILTIYSEDLTENIPLSNSITFFEINTDESYNHTFHFNIPISGEYTFNLTLLIEDDDNVKQYYINKQFVFYDYQNYEINNIIIDYYYDPSDNANWLYNSENGKIELKNIENTYDTGIVLGPFDTANLESAILNLEYLSEKTSSAEYSISTTSEFNSSEIYGTEWKLIHTIGDENNISLEIPKGTEIFILLKAKDDLAESSNFWEISKVYLERLSVKHSLSISSENHYFFEIGDDVDITLEITNAGTFHQQLGNISIVANLFSQDGAIDSYVELPSISSNERQDIKINIDNNLDPGVYFVKLETTIIDKGIFFEERLLFISISNHNTGSFELMFFNGTDNLLIENQNDNIEILINTNQINKLDVSSIFTITELTENYYILKLSNAQDTIEFSSQSEFIGNIMSIINMDEVKYSILDDNTQIDTIEGITAPSVIFDDGDEKILTILIKNEGFYTETYNLNYIYSPTFVSEIEGMELIEILPNHQEAVDVRIKPLGDIPREGGSQFNIEISNRNENKIITYVFSYLSPSIEISQISCDRYALLAGQSLKCTTSLINRGYSTNDLAFVTYSQDTIIEEAEISKLDHLETWTITTTYEPQTTGEMTVSATVMTKNGDIFEKEMDSEIKIISTENSVSQDSNQINLPEINTGRSIVLLTLAGILYQIKRSENLKYLGLKFFFIPMYSRLQKDTLADEPTRQKLLKYIYAEPGANFKQLKDRFSLHNGTLAHHINILENHDIITSHRSGRQRLFFPMGINREISRISLITNETQRNIMDIVKETPGITQSMISKQLVMSRQKINYHVNSLVDKAFLKIEKQGRITRLYPLYYT